MAAITKHILALEVPDMSCPDVMRIFDASIYADGIPVDCERLEILVPGFAAPSVFTYEDELPLVALNQGFDRTFSAVDLCIQAGGTSTISRLPDGIYVIQYSVSPNEERYVKYYFLRVTILLNLYYKELCKLQLAECEPTREVKQKLNDLRYIKSLIDAAKAKADTCNATQQAIDMYHYAHKLLKKYMTGCCVTCS